MKTVEVGASPVAYEHLSTVIIGGARDPNAAVLATTLSIHTEEYNSFVQGAGL